MTENLEKIAKEEIGKLPKENQETINSLDWAGITEKIGVSVALAPEEINDVQTEVLLVLIGIEYSDLFPIHIENNIGLTKEETRQISEQVFEKCYNRRKSKKQSKEYRCGMASKCEFYTFRRRLYSSH
jgi:hypothetical protein